MVSISYTRTTRISLLFISAFLLAIPSLWSLLNPSSAVLLDACYLKREETRPPPPFIPLGDSILHNYSVLSIWICVLLLIGLPHARLLATYQVLYTSLWFHSTYIVLAALKAPLDDFACAGRHPTYPNGISGHYCYFLFVALTAPQYFALRLSRNAHPNKVLVTASALLLTFFCVGGFATLYRTYFHGYHSLRQICLGASLGIASHVSLEWILYRNKVGASTELQITSLAAFALTALSWYARVWPESAGEEAIGKKQIIFHASLWLGIGGVTWVKHANDKKVAKE